MHFPVTWVSKHNLLCDNRRHNTSKNKAKNIFIKKSK